MCGVLLDAIWPGWLVWFGDSCSKQLRLLEAVQADHREYHRIWPDWVSRASLAGRCKVGLCVVGHDSGWCHGWFLLLF